MQTQTIYIKAERNVETTKDDVFLSDIAKVTCTDAAICAKAKALKICRLQKEKKERCVVSILKIIEQLQKIDSCIEVQSLGECDIVIEKINTKSENKVFVTAKIVFVVLICFVGTAFTIMAFHNDIGIEGLFRDVYDLFSIKTNGGLGILEITYSIGLSIGILVFFNHFGNRRITKDPTPIEVEMRLYEDDVNTTLIANASREKEEIDV